MASLRPIFSIFESWVILRVDIVVPELKPRTSSAIARCSISMSEPSTNGASKGLTPLILCMKFPSESSPLALCAA